MVEGRADLADMRGGRRAVDVEALTASAAATEEDEADDAGDAVC